MTTDDLLQEGIAALKAGHKTVARNMLMQVVQQDERNEMAWLWLSGTVDTDEERRICLENVLSINPNNGLARRGLESLLASRDVQPLRPISPPTPSTAPATTPRERRTHPPAHAVTPDEIQRKKRKVPPKREKAAKQQRGLIIGIVAGVSAVACIVFIGIWWAINSRLLQLGPAAPVAADITQIPPTAIPSGESSEEVESEPTVAPTVEVRATDTPRPTVTSAPTKVSTATPVPRTGTPEPPSVGTRSLPVPFGEPFELVMGETKRFTLAFTEIYRGEEAWPRIEAANRFNDPPDEGMHYLLLYAEVNYLEGPDDEPLMLDRGDFKSVSRGHVLDRPSVVSPDPDFDISFFPGAIGGGWLTLLTFADDPDPLAVIGMAYDNTGGFYFAAHP